MGKKKTETKSNQQITYTDWKPQDTPDIQAYRQTVNEASAPTLEPLLQAQADHARRRSMNALNSSYNQNIPAVTRQAMLANQDRELTADYGTLLAQSDYQDRLRRMGGQGALAELTMARPLQTGSSGTSTQIQSGGMLGSILGAGLSLLPKFLIVVSLSLAVADVVLGGCFFPA